MMLLVESGTLPHRPWTPMSLVNGRSPQAKRCGRDGAKRKSVRKRLPLRGSRCVEILRGSRWHHREATASRKGAKHHREAAPQCKARHHRGVTASREGAKHHREATPQRKARHLRESNLPNQQHRDTHPATRHIGKQLHSAKQTTIGTSNLPNQQHLDEQPAEPAASGRATCRTSTIGKRMFWQIMVPKGQVLRG